MEDKPLVIGGKSYISSRRAASLFNYTTDYIGQLSRSKKIESVMVGRDRFIEYSSLVNYVDSMEPKVAPLEPGKAQSEPGQVSGQVGLSSFQAPNKLSSPRSNLPFLATLMATSLGLLMFFTGTNLGRSSLSNFGVALAVETPALSSGSNGLLSLLDRADEIYLGFLEDIERALARLWNATGDKALAYLRVLFTGSETETIVVNNIPATITIPTAEVPVSVTPGTVPLNTLSEAQVRAIAREIVGEELAKTIDYASRSNSNGTGLIVRPAGSDQGADQKVIDTIKDSFSDEVSVTLDSSRASGVVRPIFRNPTDDLYHFILVPINQGQ